MSQRLGATTPTGWAVSVAAGADPIVCGRPPGYLRQMATAWIVAPANDGSTGAVRTSETTHAARSTVGARPFTYAFWNLAAALPVWCPQLTTRPVPPQPTCAVTSLPAAAARPALAAETF